MFIALRFCRVHALSAGFLDCSADFFVYCVQAKCRFPRLENTKHHSKLWRPQAHCVGVLVAGVMEAYYFLPPQLAADSNMNITLLTHTLDLVQHVLSSRGKRMPSHIVFQQDNTAREGRNQWVMQLAAALILKETFRSVTIQFLPVGHTHIDIDQRFSIIATALKREDATLHTIEDSISEMKPTMMTLGH